MNLPKSLAKDGFCLISLASFGLFLCVVLQTLDLMLSMLSVVSWSDLHEVVDSVFKGLFDFCMVDFLVVVPIGKLAKSSYFQKLNNHVWVYPVYTKQAFVTS